MKKPTSKVAHNWPHFFFQYSQPTQNQPKSQFLFHKNCSPRELCIMTLKRSEPVFVPLCYFRIKSFLTMFASSTPSFLVQYIKFIYSDKATVDFSFTILREKLINSSRFCGRLRKLPKKSENIFVTKVAAWKNKLFKTLPRWC
jgi:hypothetical protein